jgi:biopolymer transport protein ExbD
MKPRKTGNIPEKVTFDMTPMIDCCFQLIIFFILSLKIFTPEGDFSVKMPLAKSEGEIDPTQLPPVKLRMRADGSGKLVGITMGAKPLSSADPFAELRREIRAIIKDDLGPGSTGSKQEVELDCDPGLHYQYVIRAITAVSGYVDMDTRQIVKLVEKIKFSQRRQG